MNPGRKKRIKKGIKSLEQRIAEHEDKLREAKERGIIERADYYEREIKKFEVNIEKKKKSIK